jgi:ketosteroid isomerase-like protein
MNYKHATSVALFLALATSLTACQKPAPTVDKDKIAAAVKADWDNVEAGANSGDATKAVSSDAPDIVNMFHGEPNLVGIDADLKNTQAMIGTGAKISYSAESVDVADAGDMAIYRATYDMTYSDPKTKKSITDHGNAVAGYKKQADGSWKIAWTIFADEPAPAAPAATPAKS